MFDNIPLIQKKLEAFRNPIVFLTNRGGVMDKVKPYFFTSRDFRKVDIMVLFQDITGKGHEFALQAKEKGLPIVVVQHGRSAIRDYLPPIGHKLLADKICVWGKRDHEMMVNNGFDPNRVVLTGCPLFEGVERKRKSHKGINVLFAPAHYEKEIQENIDIMDKLRAIKSINAYAKLLSVHKKELYGKNTIISNSYDKNHVRKCFDILRTMDILVTNEIGTIVLLAMYLNINVIYIDNVKSIPWNEKVTPKNEKIDISGTYNIKSVDELPATIDNIIKEPDKLKKDREFELLQYAGIGLPGSPNQKIINIIKELAK